MECGCGAELDPDYACHCEICGNPICDDCQREYEDRPYCLNCYQTEIDPTGELEA